MSLNRKISLTLFLLTLVLVPQFHAARTNKVSVISGSNRSIKDVLLLIEEKMKTGSPLNKIMGMLEDLKNDILDEQSRHEVLANKQRSECQEETVFRTKQIEDAEQALNSATARKNSCQIESDKSKSDLKTNVQGQENTKNMLILLSEEKKDVENDYEIKQKDHMEAQKSIDESLDIMEELFSNLGASSPNFLQEVSKVTITLLQSGMKVRGGKYYVDALSSIAFLSTQPDLLTNNDDIDKVKSLLAKVRENIGVSWENFKGEFKTSLDRFEFLKNNLETTLETLETNQREVADQILAMEQCIHSQGLIVQASDEKKGRNTELLESAKKMCENFETEYKLSSQARKTELELIDNVKKIVDDKFKQLSSNVVTSFASKEWSPYHKDSTKDSENYSML